MEDRKFVVIDAEGKEKEMVIMFTYTHEETKKNYVFYTDPTDDNQEGFVSSYDEEGNLYPVETDEEWELLEKVFDQYQAAEEECDDHCCHHHDHDCDCGDDCDCDCDGECECNHEHCDCENEEEHHCGCEEHHCCKEKE